jgi:hypothetical protein
VRVQHPLDTLEVSLPLFVFVEEIKNIYFDAPDGAIDMSVLAILLFVGTMALSLWATMRVRQVYGKFSQLPASSGASGAETAATILRQEGIYDVQIVEHDEILGAFKSSPDAYNLSWPAPSFEVDQLLSVVSPLRLTSFYLSIAIEPRLTVSD